MEVDAGLGALGFWLFIAAVIVAGTWFDARKRESQQETLRRIVESGQPIDQDVIDKLLSAPERDGRADRDFKVGALIMLFVAPGLAAFAWFLGRFSSEAGLVMYGVSALVGIIGVGLWAAGKLYERWYRQDQSEG